MFVASKLLGLLASGAMLIFLVLTLGNILLLTRWRRIGVALVSVATLCLLAAMTLPVADWVALPLESRFRQASVLPDRVDGIIVLAGGSQPDLSAAVGQPSLGEEADRFVAFVMLARLYPNAQLIFAGGSGRLGGGLSAADEIKPLFSGLGLDPAKVIYEGDSRTTYETAVALSRMIRPAQDETWLLVTSAQHMPRSIGVFRQAGLDVHPYQVDYRTDPTRPAYLAFNLTSELWKLESPLHEWVGLVAYYWLGYTSELFPAP